MSGGKVSDKHSNEDEEKSSEEAPGHPESPPVTVHEGIGIGERFKTREVEEHCSEEWEWKYDKNS